MEREFYIAVYDKENKPWTYESKDYKLFEIELLKLIKICLNEHRSTKIGHKLLAVYKDVNKEIWKTDKIMWDNLTKFKIENDDAKLQPKIKRK